MRSSRQHLAPQETLLEISGRHLEGLRGFRFWCHFQTPPNDFDGGEGGALADPAQCGPPFSAKVLACDPQKLASEVPA